MMNRIRYFNKYFLNRILGQFAKLPFGSFAMIRHVGRKSGNLYHTPIMVFPIQDGFLIALTYGTKTDWYQNVQAAGHCTLIWHQREFMLDRFAMLPPEQALPLFPQPQRTILKVLGVVQNYVTTQVKPLSA